MAPPTNAKTFTSGTATFERSPRTRIAPTNAPDARDEPVVIPMEPEDALRALMQTGPHPDRDGD
jgi:hypothetical protein